MNGIKLDLTEPHLLVSVAKKLVSGPLPKRRGNGPIMAHGHHESCHCGWSTGLPPRWLSFGVIMRGPAGLVMIRRPPILVLS